jgi:hypothetical protein
VTTQILSSEGGFLDKRLSNVAVDRDLLEAFRGLVLKKYGCIKGHLGPEADRALEEYIHAHRPQIEQQQQKDIAIPERRDVQRNLNMVQQALYNDRAIGSKVKGHELMALIYRILHSIGLRAGRRVVRTYVGRLLKRKVIRFKSGSGRRLMMGKEEYELV